MPRKVRRHIGVLCTLGILTTLILSCGEEPKNAEPVPSDQRETNHPDTSFSKILVNNLRMRSEPNLTSETLLLLPQGVVVRTWGQRSHEKSVIALRNQQINDYWYMARYQDQTGWIFGGGLEDMTEDPLSTLMIVPGQQAGPVFATDSEQDVINRLGKSRCERRTISIGEGETVQGTAVFPGTAKELLLLWQEEDFEHLHEVRIEHPEAPWHTPEGVGVGKSLKDINKINEVPFALTGFEWDYAGTTTSWNQGKLPNSLVLVFAPPERFHRELIGDQSFQSDNARMRRANPIVRRMRILF